MFGEPDDNQLAGGDTARIVEQNYDDLIEGAVLCWFAPPDPKIDIDPSSALADPGSAS